MAVSDWFSFDNVADEDAKARRAMMNESTGNMVSNMMQMATSYKPSSPLQDMLQDMLQSTGLYRR